jgi:hypothetical protein
MLWKKTKAQACQSYSRAELAQEGKATKMFSIHITKNAHEVRKILGDA